MVRGEYMAYAFNDDKSKCNLNGVGVIPISTIESYRTIAPGETKFIGFSTDSIKIDDVLGILSILIMDINGVVSGLIIGLIDFDEYALDRASFEVGITNATSNPVKLSANCRIKVRTLS